MQSDSLECLSLLAVASAPGEFDGVNGEGGGSGVVEGKFDGQVVRQRDAGGGWRTGGDREALGFEAFLHEAE